MGTNKKQVLVIGAGLAGTTLCNELAADCEVKLLEIGPAGSIRYPKPKFLRRKLAVVDTFCFGGGGTTNLWHNGLIPLHAEDVQSPVLRGMLALAHPYMDRAAHRLFFPDTHYSSSYQKSLDEARRYLREMGEFPSGVDCLLYPKRFHPLRPLPSVQARYCVRDLEFDCAGGTLRSVRFTDDSGSHQWAADALVISAGSMGSPRLVNQILDDAAPRAGTGLMDHPIGFVGKVRLKPQHRAGWRYLSRMDQGEFESWAGLRVKSRCGRYSAIAFLRPSFTMSNELRIHHFKSLLGASKGMTRLRNAISLRTFDPDILAEIAGHVTGSHPGKQIFEIMMYFEQRRGRNSVSYAAQGMQIDWGIDKQELAVYNEMVGSLRESLAPLCEEMNIVPALSEDWLWSAAHHSGTVSLGDASGDILDTNLRMRACGNVFVCDASVIQEHSYANTGLTIAQFALRLADHVRQS